MALILCPECGKQVSDKAPTCPQCGCPINTTLQPHTVPTKYILKIHRATAYAGLATSVYVSINNQEIGKLMVGQNLETEVPQEPFVLSFLQGGSIKGLLETTGKEIITPSLSKSGIIDCEICIKMTSPFTARIKSTVKYY